MAGVQAYYTRRARKRRNTHAKCKKRSFKHIVVLNQMGHGPSLGRGNNFRERTDSPKRITRSGELFFTSWIARFSIILSTSTPKLSLNLSTICEAVIVGAPRRISLTFETTQTRLIVGKTSLQVCGLSSET